MPIKKLFKNWINNHLASDKYGVKFCHASISFFPLGIQVPNDISSQMLLHAFLFHEPTLSVLQHQSSAFGYTFICEWWAKCNETTLVLLKGLKTLGAKSFSSYSHTHTHKKFHWLHWDYWIRCLGFKTLWPNSGRSIHIDACKTVLPRGKITTLGHSKSIRKCPRTGVKHRQPCVSSIAQTRYIL